MMRTYVIFFILIIEGVLCLDIAAKNEKTLFVYQNETNCEKFSISQIDSITHQNIDGIVNQIIWCKEGVSKISALDIDSISFIEPNNVLFEIPQDNLNGWDLGYNWGGEYMVAHFDKSNNTITTHINKVGGDANNGLIMCINENYDVIKIGTTDKLYDVKYEDDHIVLYRINDEDRYEEETIPIEDKSQKKSIQRIVNPGDFWNLISNGINFIDNIKSAESLGSDILNWDIVGGIKDALTIGGGILIGKINPIAGTITTIGQWTIGYYINQNEERQRTALYGNCEIEIDEIKPENGNSVVYVTVKNANTLYDYLVNMYDRTENEKTRNLVSCGIVVRSNNEYVTTHLNEYKSQEAQLNGDVRYGSTANFSFTIPGLDLTKNFATFYFRPYLTSTRLMSNNGDISEAYIKYGKTLPYHAFNGEVVEFNQYSAQYTTDMDNYGFVMFDTSIHAKTNNLDNIEEWGVYVFDLNGSGTYDFYPSEFKAGKYEDWIDINFNINKNEFDEINYDYFYSSKKIKIGVYQKVKNPTGNYDYLSYFYSEPQEYELVYDKKPSLTFTGATVDGTEILDQDEDGYVYYATQHTISYEAAGTFWFDNLNFGMPTDVSDNVGLIQIPNGDGAYTGTYYYQYPNNNGIQMFLYLMGNLTSGGTFISDNMLLFHGIPVTSITIEGNSKSPSNILQKIGGENLKMNSTKPNSYYSKDIIL